MLARTILRKQMDFGAIDVHLSIPCFQMVGRAKWRLATKPLLESGSTMAAVHSRGISLRFSTGDTGSTLVNRRHAATHVALYRRARHRSVSAKHATIAREGLEPFAPERVLPGKFVG